MKHLRKIGNGTTPEGVNKDVSSYHVITYDKSSNGISYYKRQYIEATYNITAVGEYGIVGNRTNGKHFGLSIAPYMSVDGGEKIPTTYSYVFDTVGEHKIKFYMVAFDKSLYRMFDFYDCAKGSIPQLVKVNWSRYFNPSTINSLFCLFQQCVSLTSVGDLSDWDTSNTTGIVGMFYECKTLTSIGDLSKWDVSNMTSFDTLFTDCYVLTSVGDLSKWDTANVSDMGWMFNKCYVLTSVGNLDNWNVSNVTNMTDMFQCCYVLTSVGDLSKWNTSNVTDMSYMFNKCHVLTSVGDLSNWNVSNVTNMAGMFQCCYALTSVGDLSKWNTSNVSHMGWMFNKCYVLTLVGDLSKWNLSGATNMAYMFSNCVNLTSVGDLSKWDVSNITDMRGVFQGTAGLTDIGDISNWDVSNVKSMYYMFAGTYIKELDLHKWDTRNVTNMNAMFETITDAPIIGYDQCHVERLGVPPVPKGVTLEVNCSYMEEIIACGKLSGKTVIFGNSHFSRENALKIIDALDDTVSGSTLTFGATTIGYLTDEDKQKITDKGWTLSSWG